MQDNSRKKSRDVACRQHGQLEYLAADPHGLDPDSMPQRQAGQSALCAATCARGTEVLVTLGTQSDWFPFGVPYPIPFLGHRKAQTVRPKSIPFWEGFLPVSPPWVAETMSPLPCRTPQMSHKQQLERSLADSPTSWGNPFSAVAAWVKPRSFKWSVGRRGIGSQTQVQRSRQPNCSAP